MINCAWRLHNVELPPLGSSSKQNYKQYFFAAFICGKIIFIYLLQYDREEALLELSEFRENNKILIESHVEAGSDLPETRSYYEQLISLMNG